MYAPGGPIPGWVVGCGSVQAVLHDACCAVKSFCGSCVVFYDLGTLLYCCLSCFPKVPNPKSTNLCAGSLDGAPIHRHFENPKTETLPRDVEVSYSTSFTQLAFRCFICIHRLQRDCHCNCDSRARCAAAVRSHNTTTPLRPRRGPTPLGGRHTVEPEGRPRKQLLDLDMCWLLKDNSG